MIQVVTKVSSAALFLPVFLLANTVLAQDDFFEELDFTIEQRHSDENEASWSITGWLREKIGYGLKDPPPPFSRTDNEINRVESLAFARLDWQINERSAARISARASADAVYRLQGRDQFHRDEIDEFERRLDLRDAYVESQLTEHWYVKAGQQIIAWGQAENLRIIDLVNTQDQYTLGQQDLEDLRLPVPALQLSYSHAGWIFDSVITVDAGHNDFAPAFDEFDLLADLHAANVSIDTIKPEKPVEYLVQASTHYNSGDFAFVIADVNANEYDVRSLNVLGPNPIARLDQDRFKAVGISANWTQGSFLMFGDIGIHFDRRLQPDRQYFLQYTNGWLSKDQLLGAIGIEYNGFHQLVLTGELDYVQIRDYDNSLNNDRKQLGYSLRSQWTAFNDRLRVIAMWSRLPNDDGKIARLSVDYEWNDMLEFGALWVGYSADRGKAIYPFRNNDMIQLQVTYNFQN